MSQDQVFINFRGRDGRYGFVNYLKKELRDNNINVFTDEEATKGEPLGNLFKHIRKSKIVLAIFSKHYADSDWCLDELMQIKTCTEWTVLFYKVKGKHVKKQSGKFGERFLKLQSDLLGEQRSRKKKAANSRIKRWKRSLVCVAGKMGLTYEKQSSEEDFVRKIVEEVKKTLAKMSAKEGRSTALSPSPEKGKTHVAQTPENPVMFDVNHLSKVFHFSRPLEGLNLERLNPEGRTSLAGLLSSMQNTDGLRFLPREVTVNSAQHLNLSNGSHFPQLPPNLHSLHAHSPLDLIEKATNLLALLMQTHPALIFTHWDKMDQTLKNDIVYYARRKSQQIADELRRYNGGVDLKPVSLACLPVCEAPSWFRMIDHKLPQDSYETGPSNASISVYRSQINPLPSNIMYETNAVPTRGSNLIVANGDDRKEREDTTCFSLLCYWFKLCLCMNDEQEILLSRGTGELFHDVIPYRK